MQFILTKEFLTELKKSISNGEASFVEEQIASLHPADIAEILDEVNMNEAKYIYKILDEEKAADVLIELDEGVREEFLDALTAKEIADQIENMDSDDAASLISELSEEKQLRVISEIEDKKQAEDIASIMSYDEDTAGAYMATEMITVRSHWSVTQCIREMRAQAQDVEYVYTIYVTDEMGVLTGMLSLKTLLFASPKVMIADLIKPNVKSVFVSQDIEDVAKDMEKYDLVAIPVTNEQGVLLGRITIDDIVDVIKEEAERDYQMASGISTSVESSDSILRLSRARLPWLLVGLLGGILGSQVIGLYEQELSDYPKMAFFIPLIAAMGGNVGVQASAIIVQALANKTIDFSTTTTKLLKELGVALINGLVCSIVVFGYNIALGQDLLLTMTVCSALLIVIIFAGLLGTFIPLVLNKYKIDPALATGPFITTMNDVIGLFLYFSIGWLIYFT